MSMALKYNMKKRMAKGGHVKGVHAPMDSRIIHAEPGTSEAGNEVRWAKAHRHSGDEKSARAAEKAAKGHHAETLSELKTMPRPHGEYAEGGMIGDDDDDLVMSIMKKRYASGGEVSNDTGDGMDADAMENQFDYLVEHGDEQGDADYTGADSGDEVGNESLDKDDDDLVGSIMKSRKKKDKMPSPA